MLKIMLCAALAITVATAASGAPKGGGGSAGDVYRFVGYATTTPRTGGEGFVAMHTSCQEDFVPLARMSTTEEFWLSPDAAYPDAGAAWVHPVGARNGTGVDFTGSIGMDSSGHCEGWSSGSASRAGATIGAGGGITRLTCDVARQVTCAAPAK